MTLARIGIVVAAALAFVACRPGEGDYCQCPGECRNGLVCTQGGAVLDSCIPPGPDQAAGRCIEQDGLPDMVDTAEETAAPLDDDDAPVEVVSSVGVPGSKSRLPPTSWCSGAAVSSAVSTTGTGTSGSTGTGP